MSCSEVDSQTDIQTDTHTESDRQTDRHTHTERERERVRQTDRQKETERQREREEKRRNLIFAISICHILTYFKKKLREINHNSVSSSLAPHHMFSIC